MENTNTGGVPAQTEEEEQEEEQPSEEEAATEDEQEEPTTEASGAETEEEPPPPPSEPKQPKRGRGKQKRGRKPAQTEEGAGALDAKIFAEMREMIREKDHIKGDGKPMRSALCRRMGLPLEAIPLDLRDRIFERMCRG